MFIVATHRVLLLWAVGLVVALLVAWLLQRQPASQSAGRTILQDSQESDYQGGSAVGAARNESVGARREVVAGSAARDPSGSVGSVVVALSGLDPVMAVEPKVVQPEVRRGAWSDGIWVFPALKRNGDIVISVGETFSVHLSQTSSQYVLVDLSQMVWNRVALTGARPEHFWVSSVHPEDSAGDLVIRTTAGLRVRDGRAEAMAVMCYANYRKAAAESQFDFASIEGQRWTVSAVCPGYVVADEHRARIDSPSQTTFVVEGVASAITISGAMGPESMLVLYDGMDVVRTTAFGADSQRSIDRLNRGRSVKVGHEYVLRVYNEDGSTVTARVTTNSEGQAYVDLSSYVLSQPWTIGVIRQEIADLHVYADGRWTPASEHFDQTSSVNG